MNSTLTALFEHNIWANDVVLDVASKLDEKQLGLTSDGCFGNIRDTVFHIVTAQTRYAELLGGKPISRPEAPGPPEELRGAARESGGQLRDIAGSLKEGTTVRREFGGKAYDIEAEVILLQMINHATDHRTQLKSIFAQNEIECPELDGWTWASQEKHIREVAE